MKKEDTILRITKLMASGLSIINTIKLLRICMERNMIIRAAKKERLEAKRREEFEREKYKILKKEIDEIRGQIRRLGKERIVEKNTALIYNLSLCEKSVMAVCKYFDFDKSKNLETVTNFLKHKLGNDVIEEVALRTICYGKAAMSNCGFKCSERQFRMAVKALDKFVDSVYRNVLDKESEQQRVTMNNLVDGNAAKEFSSFHDVHFSDGKCIPEEHSRNNQSFMD